MYIASSLLYTVAVIVFNDATLELAEAMADTPTEVCITVTGEFAGRTVEIAILTASEAGE